MFDEKTEELCAELGLQVCFPTAALRNEIDDKVETTRIADRAGVQSVPNVLARVESYKALRKVSKALGDDLVIQTAYGDSGHTTFFVSRHRVRISDNPHTNTLVRFHIRHLADYGM